MGTKQIKICYSGSLTGIEESDLKNRNLNKGPNWLHKIFWTYQPSFVDYSTRTAYYLIKAVKLLKEKGVTPDQIIFSFWGNIHQINVRQIKENGVEEYFEIDGYLTKEESLRRLDLADVLFLPQEMSTSKEFRSLFIPGKVYEYLNARKPILSLSEPSDCQEIIKASGLGVICKPNDPEDIAEKIELLLSKTNPMEGIQVNEELIASYSFKNKAKRIAEIFSEVLNEK